MAIAIAQLVLPILGVSAGDSVNSVSTTTTRSSCTVLGKGGVTVHVVDEKGKTHILIPDLLKILGHQKVVTRNTITMLKSDRTSQASVGKALMNPYVICVWNFSNDLQYKFRRLGCHTC